MTILHLIRHGRSTWNALGRIQGQADPPLDDLGRRQVQALAERYRTASLAAIYSSPLARARETAEALAAPHGLPVTFDPRLMERHFGEWTGLTGDELEARVAERPDLDWRRDGPPGGESRAAVMARVADALDAVAAAHPEGRVAVVGHGACLGAYLFHLFGLAPDYPVTFLWDNTAVTQIRRRDGRYLVQSLNDSRHLDLLNGAP